jgi:SAM-dependent methyltransferase
VDRTAWNERYGTEELIWKADPNRFVVEEVDALWPGRALDVACGEGRNAIWLATKGWQATGVDFSAAGLAKARRLADERGVHVTWIEADLTEWEPEPAAYDLVLLAYLQLPGAARSLVHRRMAAGLAPGGTLLVVAHDSTNLTDGYGGPSSPEVLFSPDDVLEDLAGLGLEVQRASRVGRAVATPEGERTAIDALVRVRRPGGDEHRH